MAHRVSSRARSDLDDIWRHVVTEGGSESAADGVVDLITDRFLLLSDWPRLGRARNDLRRGLRSFPAGDYVIFYRITRAGGVIQRVLHGHRDIAGSWVDNREVDPVADRRLPRCQDSATEGRYLPGSPCRRGHDRRRFRSWDREGMWDGL